MKKIQATIISSILLLTFALLPFAAAAAPEITVATANSVCPALKKAGDIFSRQQGVTIHYICKSSGALAKGLETSYISADYYISASQKWMDHLVARGLIAAETVKPLWDNKIIAAAANQSTLELQNWNDLATPKVTTIIVGDPSTTPLGRQFKNAMLSQGLWSQIRTKIVAQKHISSVQESLLAADNTTIGILFPTHLGNKFRKILDMPGEWHVPMRYYGGPLIESTNKDVTTLFNSFLKSNDANEVFHQQGYLLLP